MSTQIWMIGNTVTVEVEDLRNVETGEPVGSGYTVQVTLTHGDGTPVAGVSWPVQLSPDFSDPARPRWVGRVSHLAQLTDGQEVTVVYEAYSSADDVYAEWMDYVVARRRGVRQ